ncbi:MAG: D-glycero-beta-D-manno-heptose 1,7-bisphosphate 7-phosphatase [Piscirickettsiaceae bacterium]|nr:D-glycero-beta-D-manno-heptose 1,7-bisphosphate 7-phosphatase [Piscirickettsiaceae bacterium]
MPLIILDRDGVINHDSEHFIKSSTEWHAIDGSLEAIVRLNHANYQVVVITNQSGIARGLFDIPILNRIHSEMQKMLSQAGGKIEAILFCPHGPCDNCNCRKPKDGSFKALARRLQIKLDGVPAIGDSLRDIQAAKFAGATPILVGTGKGKRTFNQGIPEKVAVYNDLAAAVTELLKPAK